MASSTVIGNNGELVKMTITAFEDENYEREASEEPFEVMYNPNTYSQEYKNFYEKVKTEGNREILRFKHSESETMTFEFLFDATGASVSGTSNMANQIIEDGRTDLVITGFLELTYSIQGDTHQPRFLRLQWGDFIFEGLLEKATVTHKLFDTSGYPIRSTVNCTFRTHQSLEEQAKEVRRSSPDLTRFKLTKEEDTLPLIAFDVYDNPALYLELARINNVNNFRSLRRGERLILPPINKTQSNGK